MAKHGVHDGSTRASCEHFAGTALCWNYTNGLLRTVTRSHYCVPAKRSLRSMVPMLALQEQVVNTLLGLHSRVAPKLYQKPLSWSGKAFVAKHGAPDRSARASREHFAGTTLTGRSDIFANETCFQGAFLLDDINIWCNP